MVRDVGVAHGVGVGGAGPDEAGRLDLVRGEEDWLTDSPHNADR